MLYASILLVFLAVSLISYLVLTSAERSRGYKRSLKQLSSYETELEGKEPAKSFFDRAIAPFFDKLGGGLSRLTPSGREQHYKKKLVAAGEPGGLDTDKFVALKILSLIFMLSCGFLLIFFGTSTFVIKLLTLVILSLLGYYIPDIWLSNLVGRRKIAIRRALPDVLDLMVICVEAGLGFDAALSKIVKRGWGPIAKEFAKVLYEIQVGVPRREAFKNLSGRTEVEELRTFSHAVTQADIFGISIGKILRTQAQEVRTKRRQLAEERAQKTTVKIVFPVVLCIFPAIFIVIVGPAAIRIYSAFFGG